ncbi:MarR family winged helix-turn-helix transcriptional regulator [Aeromicrobium sp. P5_D10]
MSREEAADSRELMPGLEEQPGYLMWRAAARVSANLARVLPRGVDIHAYAALLALAGDATRSQQSVADTVDISRTTMAKVAAGLVEQGLIDRVRNPDDRRSYLLTRTPEGAVAARQWRGHAANVEDALTEGLSLAEREELHRLLLGILDGQLASDTPAPLLDSVGFLITRAHLRLHRSLSEVLAPLGIAPAQFCLLITVTTLGPAPQTEVSHRLGVSGASVVQLADDLEARGLLERRRLEGDRRTQVLHLRPGAPEVLARAGQLVDAALTIRVGTLTPTQTKALVKLLQRFITGG